MSLVRTQYGQPVGQGVVDLVEVRKRGCPGLPWGEEEEREGKSRTMDMGSMKEFDLKFTCGYKWSTPEQCPATGDKHVCGELKNHKEGRHVCIHEIT
jgi:hypothetical protein